MAFDWTSFGEGIERTGAQVSDVMLQQYRLKQEEARQKRMMTFQIGQQLEYNKDIAEANQQLQKEMFKWQADYQAELASFGNDPEFVSHIGEWTESNTGIPQYDMARQAIGMQTVDAWNRLQAGEQLSEEDSDVFKHLPPRIRGTIARLQKENSYKERDFQIREMNSRLAAEQKQANIAYMNALTEKVKGGAQIDIASLVEDRKDATEELAKFKASKDYMFAVEQAERSNMTPEEYLMTPEGKILQSFQLAEQAMIDHIGFIEGALARAAGVEPTEREPVPTPTPEAPVEEEVDELKPGFVAEKLGFMSEEWAMRGVESKIYEKEIATLAKKHNLKPEEIENISEFENVKTWATGKSEEDILGKIIYIYPNKLYRIIRNEQGAIGAEELK